MIDSSSFGKIFKITTFGESHGPALGVILDGCPSGLELDLDLIRKEMDRRRPGTSTLVTPRKETDEFEILSGVFEGKTTGTPICFLIRNQDVKSKDYSEIKDLFRPGHADFTYFAKYRHRDYRGGGRSSARETVARVAAGAIAKQLLATLGVSFKGGVVRIGSVEAKKRDFSLVNDVNCVDPDLVQAMQDEVKTARKNRDSIGAEVEVIAENVPIGLGEPIFAKLDAVIAAAMLSIPAVKGVEFGIGFAHAKGKGTEVNDRLYEDGYASNNHGGILGGLSSGAPIVVRIALKPTSSIPQDIETINTNFESAMISTKGRHDPCVGIRAVPIAESMLALVLADFWLQDLARKKAQERFFPFPEINYGISKKQSKKLEPIISTNFDENCKKRVADVANLKKGAKIHLSGVCGTGMSAVLALLKQKGFYCSGSDKAFYPPMGDVVRKLADQIYEGYSEQNISDDVDLVVIGNALSRGNSEVEHVLKNKIAFASMPEVFSALLIGTREDCAKSIVVAGTHGKTTTSAMIAEALSAAGLEPGYFIGGVPTNLPGGLAMVSEKLSPEKRTVVLEGDEYDCAFFGKFAKFLCYRPDIIVLTSIEFDHADIYASIEEINLQFELLISQLPEDGFLIACNEDAGVRNLVQRLADQGKLKANKVKFYGHYGDFKILSRKTVNEKQVLELDLNGEERSLTLQVAGEYNALNALAALAVQKCLGLKTVKKGLEDFKGVLRRQQVLYSKNEIDVIEDFAHHPTAVKKTLEALKERYPNRNLIAVFEPRSNTSRRAVFQQDYAHAFDAANHAMILKIAEATTYSKDKTEITALNLEDLVSDINSRGINTELYPTVDQLLAAIVESAKPGSVFVLMSNGDFGGLPKQLVGALNDKG